MALRVRTPAERKARDAARATLRDAKAALSGKAPPANDVAPPAQKERAREPVRSTTVRPPAAPPRERHVDVLLPSYLAWVREQPCAIRAAGCSGDQGVAPHHVPTTGSNGRQIDDLVAAACPTCHRACHDGHVPHDVQAAAVHATSLRFRRFAPPDAQRRVARELAAALGCDDSKECVATGLTAPPHRYT